MADKKVAIVTGGASGIGFAVAQNLPEEDWEVYILFHNSTYKAAEILPNAHLRQADVTSWLSLSKAFGEVFRQTNRLDFVFANAGVVAETEFSNGDDDDYDDGEDYDTPLVPIDTSTIAVNLQGVVHTSSLARHYFICSPHQGKDATLLINASWRGLYTGGFAPVYSASKAGVINFMRSIAESLFRSHGISVHAICPGPISTPTEHSDELAASEVADCFVPMERVVAVVCSLLRDQPLCDSAGKHVAREQKFGLAIEINASGFYLREAQKFSDAAARSSSVLLSTLERAFAGW
ncbi:NAD(P)-binding protein [Hypoxylon sp. NC1633]|nr:NAD(P)-binding protein [Hypoxylon sp. NC1633]